MILRSIKLILLFFLIISCEKDDICLEGSANTNRITIGFINLEYQDTTSISLKNVRGLNKDSIIHTNIGTKKLRLPLKISSNKTKYILNYNDIVDTLSINYIAIHQYLNRGCGFISNFIIDKSSENLNNLEGWIKEVSIAKDSIFNEEKTNLYIHF
jgi:hypothetical protein